jgi:hypothetical protein
VLDYAVAPGALPTLLVRYEELINQPVATLERISGFLDLLPQGLPVPVYDGSLPWVNAVSPPEGEKWRREARAIARVEHIFAPTMSRLGYRDD